MPWVTRALTHNWRLKLSALALAIFLWALVQNEPREQESFTGVPIRVTVVDSAWTVSGASTPAEVELRLSGPAREIIRLAREGITLHVPIAEVGSRDTLVSLRREWVDLGQTSGVSVAAIVPATASISFERARTRTLPVATRLRGQIPRSLGLASEIGVNPRRVRVRGPESEVGDLDSIPLEPFDLARVTRSGIYTVSVDTAALVGASFLPATVTLGIQVEESADRIFPEIPVQVGARGVEVSPATVSVRLSGARSLVLSVPPDALELEVPDDFVEGLSVGEVRRVPLRVIGVPDLLIATPEVELVTIERDGSQAAVPVRPGRGAS